MINAMEQLNCNTTNIFLGKEQTFPACIVPFNTFTGLKEER